MESSSRKWRLGHLLKDLSCYSSLLCASLLTGHRGISNFFCHICLVRCLASPQTLSNRNQARAEPRENMSANKPFHLQAVYSKYLVAVMGKSHI